MADRVIRVGALNVVAHPHSEAIYEEIFRSSYRSRRATRVRGDRFGIISVLNESERSRNSGIVLSGIIATFTQIDEESDWLNIETGKKAEDQERSQISIPDYLRPNMEEYRFKFFCKNHLLIVEIGNAGTKLTPALAERFFSAYFNSQRMQRKFGEVAITVVPDKSTISRIISSKHLKRVVIQLKAPNADNQRAAQKRFMDRLAKMHAKKIEQTVVASAGEHLTLDKELKEAASVAASNGRVDASIQSGNKVTKVSTADTPYIYEHSYESGHATTEATEFSIASNEVRERLGDE